jgi:hypothetical protein
MMSQRQGVERIGHYQNHWKDAVDDAFAWHDGGSLMDHFVRGIDVQKDDGPDVPDFVPGLSLDVASAQGHGRGLRVC